MSLHRKNTGQTERKFLHRQKEEIEEKETYEIFLIMHEKLQTQFSSLNKDHLKLETFETSVTEIRIPALKDTIKRGKGKEKDSITLKRPEFVFELFEHNSKNPEPNPQNPISLNKVLFPMNIVHAVKAEADPKKDKKQGDVTILCYYNLYCVSLDGFQRGVQTDEQHRKEIQLLNQKHSTELLDQRKQITIEFEGLMQVLKDGNLRLQEELRQTKIQNIELIAKAPREQVDLLERTMKTFHGISSP